MVRLYEFESKEIFKEHGIRIPKNRLLQDIDDKMEVEFPIMLKAQVLIGGRGKAGGVVKVNNRDELIKHYRKLKNSKINDYEIHSFLLEELIEIKEEYFLSIAIDNNARKPLLIFSKEGGVNIEELFEKSLEKVIKVYIDYSLPLDIESVRPKFEKLQMNDLILNQLMEIVQTCFQIMFKIDANLIEINPLVMTNDGLMALDAHINIDENSIFRQPRFEHRVKEELKHQEYEARTSGMSYVDLEQSEGIGLICNGAGLVMATMDMIAKLGGVPANFLDIGGGADQNRMFHALQIISNKPGIKMIFINIFGGITRCDEIASGIIKFLEMSPTKIIIRMIGTNFKEGQELLLDHGIKSFESLSEALNHLKKFL
ncbi:MAG: ATP-grasp domain-containing protein [Candidatus Helarchaeota archaeon]